MSRFPVAFRLPAFASRSSDSRPGIGSPHGRPTGPTAGPRRGHRVPHASAATGVGAPYTPRTMVLTRPGRLPDRHPPLPSGRTFSPPQHPTRAASRGIRAVQSRSPFRSSPRPRPRYGTSGASGSPRASNPAVTAAHVRGGDRPSSTDLEQRSTTSAEPLILACSLNGATSRRTARSRCVAACASRLAFVGVYPEPPWSP